MVEVPADVVAVVVVAQNAVLSLFDLNLRKEGFPAFEFVGFVVDEVAGEEEVISVSGIDQVNGLLNLVGLPVKTTDMDIRNLQERNTVHTFGQVFKKEFNWAHFPVPAAIKDAVKNGNKMDACQRKTNCSGYLSFKG